MLLYEVFSFSTDDGSDGPVSDPEDESQRSSSTSGNNVELVERVSCSPLSLYVLFYEGSTADIYVLRYIDHTLKLFWLFFFPAQQTNIT